ncbi:MAG: CAP domain-containing protein [Planctomycetaceae bacterium]|jgi:uncharacterized protein YkwD|nr:CAP domain-containing protein [Planctomycetaceae bacterium]
MKRTILTVMVTALVLMLSVPAEAQSTARTLQGMRAKKAAEANAVNVSYEKRTICETAGCETAGCAKDDSDAPGGASPHLFDRASQAFAKINEFRQQHGRHALSWSDPSGCEANNRLQERFGMGHHRHGFSHNGECAATSNYSDNPLRAVTQWINSSPHRAILLKDGVDSGAVAVTDRYATFQVFRSKSEYRQDGYTDRYTERTKTKTYARNTRQQR